MFLLHKPFLKGLFLPLSMKFPLDSLSSRAVLSPMAGVTDVAFRALCKKYGAGLTYTEFVSGTAIVRGQQSALRSVETDPSEKPVAVQLFGSSVQDIVSAAQKLENTFDIIDVNCGCPAWKVIKTGAGSEMLKSPEKIFDFISQLVKSTNKPVTVKIRAGIDDEHINAIEVAQIVEKAGAAAIAIHGRTQKQGYSGKADWELIKRVKQSVSIPVIGNGDVFTPEDFKKRIEESGVDAIMIARGAIGNPYLFTQIRDYMKNGTYEQVDKLALYLEYLELARKYNVNFSHIKGHAQSFTKGLVGGARLREKLAMCKTIDEIETLVKEAI